MRERTELRYLPQYKRARGGSRVSIGSCLDPSRSLLWQRLDSRSISARSDSEVIRRRSCALGVRPVHWSIKNGHRFSQRVVYPNIGFIEISAIAGAIEIIVPANQTTAAAAEKVARFAVSGRLANSGKRPELDGGKHGMLGRSANA